ncbi:MAG: hypothetical protein M0Z30_00665 [Actinomycetota bacterium]|nr:hypothetical protein [Actinomycetota bacterium]
MTVQELQGALARHASGGAQVYPSALALIDAEDHPTGRVWEVARIVMADQERMRYVSGGNHPEEVADTVARWAESHLSLGQMSIVMDAGGYDPDPFEPLATAGQLDHVLRDGGSIRVIQGERAGSWISDQMALTPDAEIVARVLQAVDSMAPTGRSAPDTAL